MSEYRPMLSPLDDPMRNPEYFKKLKYPLLVSPKLDGIRCVTRNVPILDVDSDFQVYDTGRYKDVCLSRELKELPSLQVQDSLKSFTGLDGELIIGNETDFGVYNRTQSHIMSVNKPHEDLRYRVFDCCDDDMADMPFEDRLSYAGSLIQAYKNGNTLPMGVTVSLVEHILCKNYDELIAEEEKQLTAGYEGVMMRDPLGRYKWNRGTFKEGLIYKLKRFQDDEGLIIGFEEGQRNTNEQTRDEKGYAERSSKKEGMVAAATLGKFIVAWNGKELTVAPGAFTHSERKAIWNDKESLLGLYLKFRYFSHGVKDLPRFPRALGFRDKIDMDSK
jgi:DNA ligase-1